MKNSATEAQPSTGEAWGNALRRFDRELRRRGAAERTRRAYGTDVGELATWASAQSLAPADIDYRTLRRWAARLSDRGSAPSTTARKIASVRAFFRTLVEHGELGANPADLLPAPKPPAAPAAHAQARRRGRTARRHPRLGPAGAARSRPVRA